MLNEHNLRSLLRSTAMLLAGSIAINAWMAHALVTRQPGMRRSLEVGDELPPVDLVDHNGKRVTLGYAPDALPVIVYWFGPECAWCKHNSPKVGILANAVRRSHRFIALASATHGLQAYLADSGQSAPTFTDPTGKVRALYGLGGTPQTAVITPEGKVLAVWTGAYDGQTGAEIERYFQVSFSGKATGTPPPGDCASCTIP